MLYDKILLCRCKPGFISQLPLLSCVVIVLIDRNVVLTQQSVLAETALARVTPEAMMLSYQINAMGPILVAKASNPAVL